MKINQKLLFGAVAIICLVCGIVIGIGLGEDKFPFSKSISNNKQDSYNQIKELTIGKTLESVAAWYKFEATGCTLYNQTFLKVLIMTSSGGEGPIVIHFNNVSNHIWVENREDDQITNDTWAFGANPGMEANDIFYVENFTNASISITIFKTILPIPNCTNCKTVTVKKDLILPGKLL